MFTICAYNSSVRANLQLIIFAELNLHLEFMIQLNLNSSLNIPFLLIDSDLITFSIIFLGLYYFYDYTRCECITSFSKKGKISSILLANAMMFSSYSCSSISWWQYLIYYVPFGSCNSNSTEKNDNKM